MNNKQLPQSFEDALRSMRKTTAGYYDPELGKFYHEKEDAKAYDEFLDLYERLLDTKKAG